MSSCCSPDGHCHTSTSVQDEVEGHATVHRVKGMACGHCEESDTKAIGGLASVSAVAVDLSVGQVTVVTGNEPDHELIAKVVDDAGYAVTGRV